MSSQGRDPLTHCSRISAQGLGVLTHPKDAIQLIIVIRLVPLVSP